MEVSELFYPRISVRIGPYSFSRGVQLTVSSARSTPFDWAKVRFTEEFQPQITLARGAPAVLSLGYDDVLYEVFRGYVAKPYSGGNANEVQLQDGMFLLEQLQVHHTFLDTTPQEVVSFLLAQAGVARAALSEQWYPERRLFPLRQKNGVQAIHAVNAAWGLSVPFFFSGGTFYWDRKPEQDRVYAFEYGVNILALSRADGVWELETVSTPFVRHSHQIRVEHPQVSGLFEVSKVLTFTNDAGFIRTRLYF